MGKLLAEGIENIIAPEGHRHVVGGGRDTEDVIIAEFEHWLVPGNHWFDLWIFIFDYFKDLLHRLCLRGLNCCEEIGVGVMSFR